MRTPVDVASLSDADLLDEQRDIAARRRALELRAAIVAGEIARRSDRELGYAGLAQRAGFLSAEALIQSVGGGTRADAAKFVAVGTDLDSLVGSAVLDGTVSVDSANAIVRGLGSGGDEAAPLLLDASRVTPEELFKRARCLRAELDAESIAQCEKEQRDLRSVRAWRRPDGMVGGSFLFDAEDGELLLSALHAVSSPRGPRFVGTDEFEPERDPRTSEQVAADALIGMIRLAVDADAGTIFGSRRPAVRVVVQAEALAASAGFGRTEESGELVSIETVERMVCDAGVIGIRFDDEGQCINVGRNQRLFTERQRIGLAVRDGGCRFPGCDRPPSWTEAHHITHWQNGGRTDLADGVLLCRRHHLLLHNEHWRIERDDAEYWLVPPPHVDATQRRVPMPARRSYASAERERVAMRV